MARFSSLSKVIPVAAVTLMTLGALAAPTSARAEFKLAKCFPHCFGKPPGPQPVILHKHGNPWGYGAAALGGMAVGLVAAGAASAQAGNASAYAGECYLVRRRAMDEDGNLYIRRVRVCE